jgi:trimeric autotransporter adhesin
MKKILIILFFLPLLSRAQIISTIAGKGTIGFGGDGGPATAAKMNAPVGIAMDRIGNCYFSGNGRIRKVDTMGIITTIAGDGSTGFAGGPVAATTTGLYNPSGIAVDTLGNIFIADKTDHLVLKVDTGGMMSIFAGVLHASGYNGDGIAATTAQLNAPTDVVTDKLGNVFIADQANNRLRRVDNSGIISTVAGNGTW